MRRIPFLAATLLLSATALPVYAHQAAPEHPASNAGKAANQSASEHPLNCLKQVEDQRLQACIPRGFHPPGFDVQNQEGASDGRQG